MQASSKTTIADANIPFADYLTPLMYGAKGDGKHDDTEALRRALFESDKQSKVLYFPSGYVFRVTGTINYYQNKYQSYTLNMIGCIPIQQGSYAPPKSGGITVTKGVNLFKDATISGSIERISFTGQRDLDVHFFDNCDCRKLIINGCNISNFGALFYDTPLSQLSQVTHNTFLTLYYFARNDKTSSGMTDATISFNYINGGMEQNDNSCFEWSYYNGSIISNNFVDYYRTIYCPKSAKKQSFVGPLSYSNQYQVFRYFYTAGSVFSSVSFSSTSDSFNWNDPDTLEKLRNYKSETYKGKDGKIYDIPPYVACCNATWNITITSAKVERNMKSLVFINSSITEYEHSRFDVSFIGNNQYREGQINYRKGDLRPFYNSGKYRQNEVRIEGIVEVMNQLPQLGDGWSNSVHGRIVQVNGKKYRARNYNNGKQWKTEWVEVQ